MSHILKNQEDQHANELWSILALLESEDNTFLIPKIHAKEMSFSTKRKVVKDN